MKRSRRVGILGGMFDPIHCGHLDVGAAAQDALDLTEMFVLPSNIPPHRPQPFASSHHRFAMVALAIAGRPGWRAVDMELRESGRSYTADTLRRLQAMGYVPSELFFISGADAFLEIATWKDYPALFDLAHFAVVSRPGVPVSGLPARLPDLAARMTTVRPTTVRLKPDASYDSGESERTLIFLIDAATADVSSTAVRQARQRQQSLAALVPPAVRQHIEQHDLYETSTPAAATADGPRGAQAGRLHGQD